MMIEVLPDKVALLIMLPGSHHRSFHKQILNYYCQQYHQIIWEILIIISQLTCMPVHMI